jgi:hypothetical protein
MYILPVAASSVGRDDKIGFLYPLASAISRADFAVLP